jgi:hypothetical protein
MMIVPLNFWAEGSLFLLFMTLATSFTAFESIGLMTGEPAWMMAPKEIRLFGFIGALFSVCMFFGQFVGIVVNYFRGKKLFDSFTQMVSAYFFVIRFTDFVPSLYIFLFEGLGQSDYSLFSPNYGKWMKEGISV